MLIGSLYSFLSLFTSYQHPQSLLQLHHQAAAPTSSSLTFTLRHLHGVSNSSNIIFHDVPPSYSALSSNAHTVRSRSTTIHRPTSQADFHRARLRSSRHGQSEKLDWEEDQVPGPDIEHRETLRELAKMTNNAYVEPGDASWYNLTDEWRNETTPFGWEPDADGFRGHIFVSSDNSTVVLSIKGTSGAFIGGGGPTAKKDKLNDNLLFSCCCARVDWTWSTVCDCYGGGYHCDQTCLEQSLQEKSLFYPVGTNLYNNVTYLYPNAKIWLVGHSLGGSLAALLGVTFGAPVVAFEAPADKMASKRLHLPSPPSTQHVTHLYHTADVIAMGACNGVLSSCAIAGYAMETRCHNGKTILYDTVSKLNWGADIRTHRIGVIIDQLLAKDWEEGLPVPKAEPEDDCVDCFSWEYGDFKNSTGKARRIA
ncbi:putative lipase atg15 [Tulasnella sp. JGI-2019a]|nr:putative lipase atg15 [Tulasnella sp. JGI-2019a]